MARPTVKYERVERGIQKITRTYDDGRVTIGFRIKYADEQGSTVSKTLRTLSQARTSLAKARVEVADGEHTPQANGRVRFKDVADTWLQGQTDMKARTFQSCRWTIDSKLKPLHDLRMKSLTYARVRDFQTKLAQEGLAPASRKRTMWILSSICEDARKRRLIKVNPCDDQPPIKMRKRRITIPTQEQIEALISRLASPTENDPACWNDARWSLLVETAAYSGLRAGELTGLRVSDFDAAKRSLSVERTIVDLDGVLMVDTPKTEAGIRVVTDLDPGLCARLAARCRSLSPRDYLFGDRDPNGTPRPLNHRNFGKRVFKKACAELGISMTFHDLRHFHVSLLIDLGLSPVEVAHRVGHSSAAFTLATYAHLFKKESTGLGDAIAAQRADARTGPVLRVVPEAG